MAPYANLSEGVGHLNIFVTGATGFVGKKLTEGLLRKGHTVYALVRSERKQKELIEKIPEELHKHFHIVFGNLSDSQLAIDESKLQELKRDKIDVIYHSAAYLSFDDSEREASFKANVEGTKNVLELAKLIGVQKFYHVSTAYTLGMKEYATETLHELDGDFVNSYEESKCHAEHLVYSYRDEFDVSIFRPSIIIGDSVTGEAETNFALYGLLRSFQLFKKRMDRKVEERSKTFTFLCNENTPSNFVPVDYVVTVLLAGVEYAERNKIYHITNGYELSNGSIFSIIKEALQLDNVVLKPNEYMPYLTKEEQRLNEPLAVFQTYLSKNVAFNDTNTKKLLEQAGKGMIYVNEKLLHHMIMSYCRGAVKA